MDKRDQESVAIFTRQQMDMHYPLKENRWQFLPSDRQNMGTDELVPNDDGLLYLIERQSKN